MESNDNPLKLYFSKDLIWAIASGLPKDIVGTTDLLLLGSWTEFNKIVTNFTTFKSIINYVSTIPEPPDYKVCKEYLNFVVNRFDILEIPYGFVYADEQVYSRLLHLIWKHKDLYANVIPILLGGFHQLTVKEKILYKHHQRMGYKDWFVDYAIIAPGSAEQGFEGRHYFRSMRLHK